MGANILRTVLHRLAMRTDSRSSRLRSLETWQEMPTGELRENQEARLTEIVRFAHEHCALYRKRFEQSGLVGPTGTVHLEDFSRTQPLDRSDVQGNAEALTASVADGDSVVWNSTSGSTGQPLRVLQDRVYHGWNIATKKLHEGWMGCGPTDTKVVVWGSPDDRASLRRSLRARLGVWARNTTVLDSAILTDERMRAYLRLIDSKRPKLLRTYASPGYELARFAELNDLKPHPVGATMSTAARLFPQARRTMENGFGGPVFDKYGCREMGDVACECEAHGGLHVTAPTHYVEVVRADGTPAKTGEPGQLLVTGLVNRAMPLIRYRVGDGAAFTERTCPCGRNWPLLRGIVGRSSDVLVRHDGSVADNSAVAFLLTDAFDPSWIRRFQFIQEAVDHVRFIIQPFAATGAGLPAGFQAAAEEKMRAVLGGECRVDVEIVDEIANSAAGKHNFIISRPARKQKRGLPWMRTATMEPADAVTTES